MTAGQPRSLRPSATRSYLDLGYCVGDGLLDQTSIDRVVRDLGRVLRAQLEHCGLEINRREDLGSLEANLAALHRHDQKLYVSTLLVCSRLKSLYDLLLSGSIAEACHQLGITEPFMHTQPVFHLLSNTLRIDGGYHGYQVHQDWTALQSSLNAVTIWVPFHDVDSLRFPVEVLPQSHLQGLCREPAHDGQYPIDPATYEDIEFTPVPVNKGDVLFLSAFTIHRTRITEGKALRLAVSWRYEDALEPTFIERRYPLAHSRNVRHEPFFPDFPDTDQIQQMLRVIRTSETPEGD